ncbi:class I SAM-dependent methyltransferase [Holophaga foetida]|uniref:class I SAM-dependent methyltransferase n=1 Tax=Holophaga foetida TaxID=35839 RepID=UPI0002473AB4|nr:class I SAM-dependent methyltransferase [Holophaga foetida]
MEWFVRDFDHPLYFDIYQCKEAEAQEEGTALATMLDLPRGSLVLDLPCGWGRLRPALEDRGFRVVGGDLSPLNLHRHQSEYPGALARLDLRALPFRSGVADGIFCAFTSWGYFASEEENLRQLQEFHRILRPGGVLLLDLVSRSYLEDGISRMENTWFNARGGYRERVRWSPDHRRVLTDRIHQGERFRHDIWIPEDQEVLDFLILAGFEVQAPRGDLEGHSLDRNSERRIYRATSRPTPRA